MRGGVAVEDGQIIDLYWTRDQRAIQETEGKYGRLLHSIAWNLLRSREDTEEWPVLLLDDVLSELDAKRQSFVLERINGGQVLITCCEEDKSIPVSGRRFRVRDGSVTA